VLDITNTADLAGSSPAVNFTAFSTDGTPAVAISGNVQNGGGTLAVTNNSGTAIQVNSTGASNALDITGGGVRSSAPLAVNQFASTYVFAAQSANNVQTIPSNVVTAGSTLILTYETSSGNFENVEVVQGSVSNGSFQVQTSAPFFNSGDKIHYLVINH